MDRNQGETRLEKPMRWLGLVVRAVVGTPARAARGTARLVGDPTRQVVDYWRSERATMRQALGALTVASTTALLAGLTLAGMQQRIEAIEGLFVLIPVSIGMRGNIFGALAARFGTAIHTGLFEASRRRDSDFFQNISAATLLTIATSVTMAVLARAIAGLLGIETVSLWDFIVVALAGGLVSSAIVLAVTVYLSATSSRRGWDLDSVGAPLITAIGDLVTLPCLFLASFLVGIKGFTPAVGALALLAGALALVRGWTTKARTARRIVRESFPVLGFAIVLDVLAGSVVQPRIGEVFLPFPALLVLIPGFLENTGALGGILSARLGSKLHLGAISASPRPDAVALLDGSIVMVLGFILYSMTATLTLGMSAALGLAHPGVLRFVAIVMVGGFMATILAAVIGYYGATTTYRFGLDPDNHTIPLVTSGMDLLGIICLVAAIQLFGVVS